MAELGFSDSCDTLGKWMAHHLAEVMDKAKHEENPKDKERYDQQAVELILKIWSHRQALNDNAYPLARFKKIIEALSILSPDANVWERSRLGKYQTLATDTFPMIVDLYRALCFVEFTSLKSIRSQQVPPSVLTDEEQELYSLLISWAQEEVNFRSDNGLDIEESKAPELSKFLSGYIDDLCGKLNQLKSDLSEK